MSFNGCSNVLVARLCEDVKALKTIKNIKNQKPPFFDAIFTTKDQEY